MIVSSAGIEPAIEAPEAPVLSVRLRGQSNLLYYYLRTR